MFAFCPLALTLAGELILLTGNRAYFFRIPRYTNKQLRHSQSHGLSVGRLVGPQP